MSLRTDLQLDLEVTNPTSAPKNWLDLPPKTHKQIVDRMNQQTLCQFSGSSKSCLELAKTTRRLMSKVEISGDEDCCELSIGHDGHEKSLNYQLQFLDVSQSAFQQTVLLYKTFHKVVKDDGEEEMRIDVKTSEILNGTPSENLIKYLKNHCEKHEDCIRIIKFDIWSFFLDNLDLKFMRNLEEINLSYVEKDWIECGIFDINQLLNAKVLEASNQTFTIDQVANFKGRHAHMRIETFGMEELLALLNLWTTNLHENIFELDLSVLDPSFVNPNEEDLEKLSNVYKIETKVFPGSCCISIETHNGTLKIIYFGNNRVTLRHL